MSKFVLNIELDDDKFCWGCPCKSTDNEGDWSCNITDVVLGFTEIPRPQNCPLKPQPTTQPEHKCETCKYPHLVYSEICGNCHNTLKNNWEPK